MITILTLGSGRSEVPGPGQALLTLDVHLSDGVRGEKKNTTDMVIPVETSVFSPHTPVRVPLDHYGKDVKLFLTQHTY